MRIRLTLLFTLLLLATLASAQVTFKDTFYQSSASQALGETSGDFNRDGKPDMAVGTNGGVDIFTNTGGGNFSGPITYALPSDGSGITTVDVNNDGWLDLLALNYRQNSINVLLNNGDGTFRNGTPVTLSMPGVAYAAGDLNNDGKVDLVALECDFNISKCQFQVVKGTGTGTFTPGQVLALANTSVGGPLLADVSRDGKLDLINTRDPKLFVWRGNGDGTFAAPTSYQPPPVCTDINVCGDALASLAVGNFNNDAALDIIVQQAHFCGSACGDNTEYVYKNNGSGSFTLAGSFGGMGTAGGVLFVTDLNGDQNMDLINMNGDHFGCSTVLAPGKGNLTFGSQSGLPGCESSDMVTRDLNLDSRHDLAISTWLGGGWSADINTSAFTNCAPPSSANLAAKVCGPANNASVTSPVLVKASGNSPAGIRRLEIWVDGVKKYEKWNDQVAKRFTLAAGSHRIAVVAIDMYQGTAKTTVTVNVH